MAVNTNPFNLTNGFDSRLMQMQLMSMNTRYKLHLDDQVRYCNLLQPHLLKPNFQFKEMVKSNESFAKDVSPDNLSKMVD